MKTFSSAMKSKENSAPKKLQKILARHADGLNGTIKSLFNEAAASRISLDFPAAFEAVDIYLDDCSQLTKDWAVPVLRDGEPTFLTVKLSLPLVSDDPVGVEYFVAPLASDSEPDEEEWENAPVNNRSKFYLTPLEIARELDFATGEASFAAALVGAPSGPELTVAESLAARRRFSTHFQRKLAETFGPETPTELVTIEFQSVGIPFARQPLRVLLNGAPTSLSVHLGINADTLEEDETPSFTFFDSVMSIAVSMKFVAARLDACLKAEHQV